MTSPRAVPSSGAARYTPAPTTGRRLAAVVLAALAVAVVAVLSALLAVFIGRGSDPSVFGVLGGHFATAGLIVAGLLAVANAAGVTRHRGLALLAGLAAGVLAALLATTLTLVGSGAAFGAQMLVFAIGSLGSVNLVFVLAATLAEALLAPVVVRGVLRARRRRRPARRIALVRIPASNLAEGELTHLERTSVDTGRADEQWDNYCAALAAEGWEIVEVDAEPELADSVFVEDAVVMFGELALLANPGAPSRRAELASVERTVRSIPGLVVARIEEPGTLDGGDVLKVGSTVYVGASSRTNAEGVRQLRALLSPHGYRVVGVPVTKALHLKSTVTALPDGTIVGHPALVDDASVFPSFLAVPEPEGVAVVQLSEETLLMSASAPESAARIAGLGYRVVTVDISEFEKLEGCVTCLSVRVR